MMTWFAAWLPTRFSTSRLWTIQADRRPDDALESVGTLLVRLGLGLERGYDAVLTLGLGACGGALIAFAATVYTARIDVSPEGRTCPTT